MRMWTVAALSGCLLVLVACSAMAQEESAGGSQGIKQSTVSYQDGNVLLEGYLVVPDTTAGVTRKRPGVLLIHDWDGLGEYERTRADMLGKLGYVALAADIYGKGVRPTSPQESSAETRKYYDDPALYLRRMKAGLEQLKVHPMVDPARLAAIGYCFGGRGVLDLARSGEDIAAVVSFHGGLDTAEAAGKNEIKAEVLVLHGAADSSVTADKVAEFNREMINANAKYTFISYPDAVHAFTVPGDRYQKAADLGSWEDMKMFFTRVLDNGNRLAEGGD